ncbi:PucR family transcriptional regulator [Virgibacillus sp. W0430]|uniref:PucR family transcriptional regulator n=1 Tax=Virgibacillus sp. W0430 TaxID=3391580 RepID=UPI003F4817E6
MSISIRNSMKLGKFRACEVVAGHEGLDKVVENITIMEVPDIVKWLKGRELILTSLFAIKDDADAQNLLIQQLYYAGASALAIKPFESMKGIPNVIIQSANKLGFPVIQIPEHVKYLDILSPVMHQIFNEKVVLQENLEQATNMLQEISLHAQGLNAFVKTMAHLTRNIVTIESEFSYIPTPQPEKDICTLSNDQKHELSVIKRPIRYERTYGDVVVPCIVAPIIVDNDYYGNITCWAVKHDHLAMDLAVLEKASTLVSLEFLRLKVKYDVEQQYKNEFMRELLFNKSLTEQDLVERGARYEIYREEQYVCILLEEVHELNDASLSKDKQLNKIEVQTILQKKWPTVLVGVIRGLICIIVPIDKADVHATCNAVWEQIRYYCRKNIHFVLGVGEQSAGPKGIRTSFFQAEQALQLTKTLQVQEDIIYYDQLGAFRLLSPLLGQKELEEFYEDTIGRLVDQDPKKELIKTLKMYFLCNESLKDTANALFIHVNTLKYRLKRVEELTGYHIRKTEEKTSLFLGLKIFELLQFKEEDN